MPLLKRPLPFDGPDWIFELKYDGFRALAVVEHARTELLSRNGHPFASFSELPKQMAASLHNMNTVLDGMLMDAVFGAHNFINEISWRRSTRRSSISKILRRAHDVMIVVNSVYTCNPAVTNSRIEETRRNGCTIVPSSTPKRKSAIIGRDLAERDKSLCTGGVMSRLLFAGIVLVTLVACGGGGSLSVTNPAVLFLSKSTLTFNARLGSPNPPAQSVDVLDTGTAGFSFTASSDSAWLTVTPTSGSNGDSLHISVAVGTLASGSYTGHITVNAIATNSPGTITVTFTIAP